MKFPAGLVVSWALLSCDNSELLLTARIERQTLVLALSNPSKHSVWTNLCLHGLREVVTAQQIPAERACSLDLNPVAAGSLAMGSFPLPPMPPGTYEVVLEVERQGGARHSVVSNPLTQP